MERAVNAQACIAKFWCQWEGEKVAFHARIYITLIRNFERLPMATIRISPAEVQVDDTIYVFASADDADAFEACIATVDAKFCASQTPPLHTRPADTRSQDMTP